MGRVLPLLASATAVLAVIHSPELPVDRRAEPAPPNPEMNAPSITFANPKAAEYFVDGTKIPDVDFDPGPSWSGLMPISGDPRETRKLFFWFWPAADKQYAEDLVFWTQGGPGCSSMLGMLQENGPFLWSPGTARPVRNRWSWTNLSHVLYVEQPVGTGFSQGVPNITNEDQLAAQFAGFLFQFLEVFSELKGKNFYATGESYAGAYIPYIANYLYEHPQAVPLNLKGTLITSPLISYYIAATYIPALNFAEKWKDALGLTPAFMSDLRKAGEKCGFANYTKMYATYPPKGTLPIPLQAIKGPGIPNGDNIKDECKLWDMIKDAATAVNPNFNQFRIFDGWPVVWSVLGVSASHVNQQSTIYFNRSDVQDAIHVPRREWAICSVLKSTPLNVFNNRTDTSLPAALSSVMPNVIQKSKRTVIMHGGLDFILLAEGTRIAIQNMTWGGKQGFQTPIKDKNFVIEGFGALGFVQQERGLTYIEIDLGGHLMALYSPWGTYKALSYLLGHEELTDHSKDAALRPTNYEILGPGPGKGAPQSKRDEL